MSDAEVEALLEEMESLLSAEASDPDAERIEDWHRRFLSACAAAERGPGWPATLLRARTLASRIQVLTETLESRREDLRKEMESQALGQRALKAYKPGNL